MCESCSSSSTAHEIMGEGEGEGVGEGELKYHHGARDCARDASSHCGGADDSVRARGDL